jgi:hypothetical protein
LQIEGGSLGPAIHDQNSSGHLNAGKVEELVELPEL